jgi:hypothetical protein
MLSRHTLLWRRRIRLTPLPSERWPRHRGWKCDSSGYSQWLLRHPRRCVLKPNSELLPVMLPSRDRRCQFGATAVKVEHLKPAGSPGLTQIAFRVESAIRGVRQGQIVKVREWEGLRSTGERYRAAERVLLFLYPNSKLGLTSPVGGALGRYRVDNAGRVLVRGISGARPKPVSVRNFVAVMRRAKGE